MQTSIPKMTGYVSVPEAARYLGVTRKVVYQLIEFDQLRAVRDRGKIMIEGASLEKCRREGRIA